MVTILTPITATILVAGWSFAIIATLVEILRRQRKNVTHLMTESTDKLSIEFWTEQRLEPEVECVLNEWDTLFHPHFRRLLKTGAISKWFQRTIDDEGGYAKATIKKIRELRISVAIQHPTVDNASRQPADLRKDIDDVRKRVDWLAQSSGNNSFASATTPHEHVSQLWKELTVAFKQLKGADVFIVHLSELHACTIKDIFVNLNQTIRVIMNQDPINANWHPISEVYWTRKDARLAMLEKTHDALSCADETLLKSKMGSDTNG